MKHQRDSKKMNGWCAVELDRFIDQFSSASKTEPGNVFLDMLKQDGSEEEDTLPRTPCLQTLSPHIPVLRVMLNIHFTFIIRNDADIFGSVMSLKKRRAGDSK
ncbi:hypothetical protein NPIL_56381 [Nephila pilipes]|uniref:Uncharacterized protein n=1 Tax=Nephila pilipes TaxID=299642 RepID=A0A8X6TNU9_NEPPI|nr:hypothetical protein NPIL_56381 [Nephila pilipes]